MCVCVCVCVCVCARARGWCDSAVELAAKRHSSLLFSKTRRHARAGPLAAFRQAAVTLPVTAQCRVTGQQGPNATAAANNVTGLRLPNATANVSTFQGPTVLPAVSASVIPIAAPLQVPPQRPPAPLPPPPPPPAQLMSLAPPPAPIPVQILSAAPTAQSSAATVQRLGATFVAFVLVATVLLAPS